MSGRKVPFFETFYNRYVWVKTYQNILKIVSAKWKNKHLVYTSNIYKYLQLFVFELQRNK